MTPTELSGAILTVSNGSTTALSVALWYEKSTATSATGNLYLTSSAGRLTVVSASIFDGTFYNVGFTKERITGSIQLFVNQYVDGELTYSTSSIALTGTVGYPFDGLYTTVDVGSSAIQSSNGQFWAQEVRIWDASLLTEELLAHADHFESYGRDSSHANADLALHWRFSDASTPNVSGNVYLLDSTLNGCIGTGSNYTSGQIPFTKFLEDYAYIPSIDYGWNQSKVRTYSSSSVDPLDAYQDERFVSLEFNMYDQLNEDISHLVTSYDELNSFLGLPMNRYRGEYEGLQQMRETYFKRLQGKLDVNLFVSMLDFFDSSFVSVVQRLLPARAIFKGDEVIVESHMLERSKYQYQLRPVREGFIDISGSVNVTDLWGSVYR